MISVSSEVILSKSSQVMRRLRARRGSKEQAGRQSRQAVALSLV